uniref:Uncharacterized protein n=1 Tax=Caldiarchaeum subterraneum TaxID=311458 RepID=A0A7C5Q5M7_CALS0
MSSDILDFTAILHTLKKTHIQTLWVIAQLGGKAKLSDIQKESGAAKSTLTGRLAALASKGLVTYQSGIAELVYKTPLCYLAQAKNIPYAYVGLLGKPPPAQPTEPETQTAVDLLHQQGIDVEKILVATTEDAIYEWMPTMNPDFRTKLDFVILNITEMNSIEAVLEKMASRIQSLAKDYITILDCTSGTRPAGIAYYTIADKLKTPLIYVYAEEKRIYWLKSRETLIQQLNLEQYASRHKHL